MSVEWIEFDERKHAVGNNVDILNKTTGKILYKKKLNRFSNHYPTNVEDVDGVLYLSRKVIYSKPHDYKKTRVEFTKPVILSDNLFRDWGDARDEMIKKYLNVGDFVELTGIRDTNSFRKIESITDNGIFGIKYRINHKKELEMCYDTSTNCIRFITGILDEDALNRGEWIRKIDLSKNKEY